MGFKAYHEKKIVQVFHCSAVNPEELLEIFEGMRPKSFGVVKLSTRFEYLQSSYQL